MLRFSLQVLPYVVVLTLLSAARLHAQDLPLKFTPGPTTVDDGTRPALRTPGGPLVVKATLRLPERLQWPDGLLRPDAPPPSLMSSLYLSFAALHVLDTHSTVRAVGGATHEGNPLLRGVSESAPGLLALKGVASAATFTAMERLRKRNRLAAIVTMAAIDATYVAIVMRNYTHDR